jgi:hypothetical protein
MAITPEQLEQVDWIVEDFNQDPQTYVISKVTTPKNIVMDIFYEENGTIKRLPSNQGYYLDSNGYYRKLIFKNSFNQEEEKEFIKKLLYTKEDSEIIRQNFFNKNTISLE